MQGFHTVRAMEKLNKIPYGMQNMWTIVWDTIAKAMTVNHKLISVMGKDSLIEDGSLIGWKNPRMQHWLSGKLDCFNQKKYVAEDLLEPFKLHIDKKFESFMGFKSALNNFQLHAYLDWPLMWRLGELNTPFESKRCQSQRHWPLFNRSPVAEPPKKGIDLDNETLEKH